MNKKHTQEIAIIGAGLAGLSCALTLEELGFSPLLFDKESEVGGRVRTDVTPDGYRFDHGFQVMLPAYPEWKRLLNPGDLDLCPFHSGAIIKTVEETFKVSDPLTHPGESWSALVSRFGSIQDKLLIGKLRLKLAFIDNQKLQNIDRGTSLEFLRSFGFSERIIHNFWKPFFAGVFLDDSLSVPASFMLFLYKMFGQSPVAVPRLGMGTLTQHLAARLKSTQIFLNTEVTEIGAHWLRLGNGKKLETKATIAAVRSDQLFQLTGQKSQGAFRGVHTFYYQAPAAPYDGTWLYLQAEHPGRLINHIAPLSNISSAYAPAGQTLLSINVLGNTREAPSQAAIERELSVLFGEQSRHWRYLRHYSLPYALPQFPLPMLGKSKENGIFICGDHTISPSQQGALESGRRAAESVANALL